MGLNVHASISSCGTSFIYSIYTLIAAFYNLQIVYLQAQFIWKIEVCFIYLWEAKFCAEQESQNNLSEHT